MQGSVSYMSTRSSSQRFRQQENKQNPQQADMQQTEQSGQGERGGAAHKEELNSWGVFPIFQPHVSSRSTPSHSGIWRPWEYMNKVAVGDELLALLYIQLTRKYMYNR